MSLRVAIDVGGTFTDVVRLDASGDLRFEKVPTTPADPTQGVLQSFEHAQAAPADTAMFTHGTTLGLNALLTRSGAATAVIATKGFRDVYLLARTARTGNYDIFYRKPPGLLERADTFEVTERLRFGGEVHTALDVDEARKVVADIVARGYQAVAVAFLHSYANPTHEQRMRQVLLEAAPDLEVSLSSDLSKEYREYERTSTAVLDAYIKPIVRTYLHKLASELESDGFSGQFLMMRSGGGAMTAHSAREEPVNLVLSGPAGGVVGAAAFAKLVDEPNMVTIDMGGTSLDASLIVEGRPVLYQGAEFEGLPINTSSLYIHTIGAGGGSIAWLDEAGGLQVGPQSAGAVPGPASYGTGGTAPTFTDAALVVGYLGQENPLGGTLSLNRTLAEQALNPIADQMGMTVTELAAGILRISTAKITGAVRSITVDLGHDPKDFSLLAFGGAGGLVALDVARELGIKQVIIPPGQGAFSALGMLMADVQHDASRTALMALSEIDRSVIDSLCAQMADEASGALEAQGFGPDDQVFSFGVDMRYSGQEHAVTVPLDTDVEDPQTVLGQQFEALHERQYGHKMTDPVEVTTFRLSAVGVVDKPELPKLDQSEGLAPEPLAYRSGPGLGAPEIAVYGREGLPMNTLIKGPAVISEHTATTVVHEGDQLLVGEHGELIITVGQHD